MAIGFNPIVSCKNVYYRDGSNASICAVYDIETPSIAAFENGTTIYLGPWVTNYRFVEGVPEGFDTSTSNTEQGDIFTGMTVEVEEEYDECTVTIGFNAAVYLPCGSCTICGEQVYSADCTNIPNGTFVPCQTLESNIFYPLDPTMAATMAPSVSPVATTTASLDSTTPTSAGTVMGNGSDYVQLLTLAALLLYSFFHG